MKQQALKDAIDREMESYLKKSYSKAWIKKRFKKIETRKDLNDEWKKRDIKKGQKFKILADEITSAWPG